MGTVDEPAGVLLWARLAFLTQREAPDCAQVAPAGSARWACSCLPQHDAPGQKRPAQRCPRMLRGPLSRLPCPIPDRGTGAPTSRLASDARRHQITIRGECGKLLVSLIDNLRVVSQSGDTCVVALVRDDPEFWGLMEQLRDLALHVVSVQDLDYGNGRQPPD